MRSDEYLECYIFEHGGAPAGYALLNKTFSQEAGGRVVWLEDLFVLPEYRSCGLGREFLDYLEKNVPAARYRLEIRLPARVRGFESHLFRHSEKACKFYGLRVFSFLGKFAK